MNIKLTQSQANEALGRLEHGETERAVALRLGVTQSCIHLIKAGKVFKDLNSFQKPPLSAHSKRCARCNRPGHHKGTCSTLLTHEEEMSVANSRQRATNHKLYVARRIQQIADVTAWKHKHPEKAKEYSKNCWERNKERLTKERKETRKACYAKAPKETWLKETFRHARRRARRGGTPYDWEIPNLRLPDYCPVLGIKLDYSGFRGKADMNSPSLDRIIPLLGYVKSNICVISLRANRLKNDSTLDEMRRILAYMEHPHQFMTEAV